MKPGICWARPAQWVNLHIFLGRCGSLIVHALVSAYMFIIFFINMQQAPTPYLSRRFKLAPWLMSPTTWLTRTGCVKIIMQFTYYDLFITSAAHFLITGWYDGKHLSSQWVYFVCPAGESMAAEGWFHVCRVCTCNFLHTCSNELLFVYIRWC